MHMTKNLSLFSNNVTFGPDCSTTLIVALFPGVSIPVLGRTRNFSGEVVLICLKNHNFNNTSEEDVHGCYNYKRSVVPFYHSNLRTTQLIRKENYAQ